MSDNITTILPSANTKTRLKHPSMYTVVFLNDDYTPMEFVVSVLKQLFQLPDAAAINLMLEIHKKGKGNVGRYTYDIACTKVEQVLHLAKERQHPLRVHPDKLA